MDYEAVKRLEVESRRGTGSALHPDTCPKLRIRGVPWAVPPRTGTTRPEFGADGTVTIHGSEAEDFPEATALLRTAEIKAAERCETCGQPLIAEMVVSVQNGAAFLQAAFGLAGKLLDKQYTLTPAQKGDLLAFAGTLPDWLEDLLAWCS